jgi:hypothetical protein
MSNHHESMINFTFNKETGNVPNCLSDAGGLTDCGNINSLDPQALKFHCGYLLNRHRYYRVASSLATLYPYNIMWAMKISLTAIFRK